MIRQLLLVNAQKWPANPPLLNDIDLGDAIDVRPVAWPIEAGLSHRGYVVRFTASQIAEWKGRKMPVGVTRHNAGTDKEPVDVADLLSSVGLAIGDNDNA